MSALGALLRRATKNRLPSGGDRARDDHGGRSIVHNLGAGFALQIANYLFPLIQLPYLARVIRVEGVGTFVFVSNIVAYCAVLIDWGFSLGATRTVARKRLDPAGLHEIFWTTITARMLLFGVSLIGLALIAASPVGQPVAPLLALGAIQLLATVITLDWYFQGLERMVMLTAVAFIARSFTLAMVFLLVHRREDLPWLVALTGVTALLGSILTIWIGRRALPKGPPRFDVRAAGRQIVEYRHFFFTRASVMAYTISAPVVLGIVSGTTTAGIYGGAERLIRAALALISQVSTVLFPRINALMANDVDAAIKALRRIAVLQMIGTAVASLGLLVVSKPLVLMLLGNEFAASVPVFRWLAILPLIIGVSNIIGIQIMIPLGMQRQLFHISLVSAVIFLTLLIWLGKAAGPVGAALALVLVEIIVTTLLAASLWTHQRAFVLRLIGRAPASGA